MKRIAIKAAAAALCASLTAGAVSAQQMSEEDRLTNVVETRQAVFKLLGYTFGPLGGMLRDRSSFDIDRIEVATDRMLALAPMIEDTFMEDTSGADGLETEALDGIWSSQEAFNQKAADLQTALGELKEAAESGDQATTMRAIGAVGQACGSCHDDFRAD